MKKENIILVDEEDNEIGTEEKLKAHQNGGRLHRAFSIFVFNSKGEMLLQRRAMGKYHCGGMWTNTCCSHPNAGETTEAAAHRKLKQEMGFDTDIKDVFTFIYRAPLDKGLTEHELDHVFVGKFDGKVSPNTSEACDFKWAKIDEIKKFVKKDPGMYTPWFKIILERVAEWYGKNKQNF